MTITYKLACTNCVSITPSYIDIVSGMEELENPSRQELIEARGGFDDFQCERCGAVGEVLVLEIDTTPSRYRKQMYMEVSQEGENISSYVEGGYEQFSNNELKTAFALIGEEAQRKANQTGRTTFDIYPVDKGWVTVVVDFLVGKTRPEVSVMHTTNMSYKPVIGLMSYLSTTLTN